MKNDNKNHHQFILRLI